MPRTPSLVRSGALMLLSSRAVANPGLSPTLCSAEEQKMGCVAPSSPTGRSIRDAPVPVDRAVSSKVSLPHNLDDFRVATRHALTGRACAATRHEETVRSDSLFQDPLAYKLAGHEGRRQPMGSWIMVPRTRYGDDFLRKHYSKNDRPCRQLVLLGVGMDARAYRMEGLEQLSVFEVDQQTMFDIKEPLLEGEPLGVKRREVVGTDFSTVDGKATWASELTAHGFDPKVPPVWLLEGLLYYLSDSDVQILMAAVGSLSALGSAVFHDSISRSYLSVGVAPMGAPFISGSDNYAALWKSNGGFSQTSVRDFETVSVDRRSRCLKLRGEPKCSPDQCRGRNVVLFVETEMQY